MFALSRWYCERQTVLSRLEIAIKAVTRAEVFLLTTKNDVYLPQLPSSNMYCFESQERAIQRQCILPILMGSN